MQINGLTLSKKAINIMIGVFATLVVATAGLKRSTVAWMATITLMMKHATTTAR